MGHRGPRSRALGPPHGRQRDERHLRHAHRQRRSRATAIHLPRRRQGDLARVLTSTPLLRQEAAVGQRGEGLLRGPLLARPRRQCRPVGPGRAARRRLRRLRIREFDQEGERRFMPEVEASSVGHDLRWGTGSFAKPERGGAAAALSREMRERAGRETSDWALGAARPGDAQAPPAGAGSPVRRPRRRRAIATEAEAVGRDDRGRAASQGRRRRRWPDGRARGGMSTERWRTTMVSRELGWESRREEGSRRSRARPREETAGRRHRRKRPEKRERAWPQGNRSGQMQVQVTPAPGGRRDEGPWLAEERCGYYRPHDTCGRSAQRTGSHRTRTLRSECVTERFARAPASGRGRGGFRRRRAHGEVWPPRGRGSGSRTPGEVGRG